MYLSNDVVPTAENKSTIKSLHSHAVSLSMDNLTANRVLQITSPQLAVEAKYLPHPYRTIVAIIIRTVQ